MSQKAKALERYKPLRGLGDKTEPKPEPFEKWSAWPVCKDCGQELEAVQVSSSIAGNWYFDCPDCRTGPDDYSHFVGYNVYGPFPFDGQDEIPVAEIEGGGIELENCENGSVTIHIHLNVKKFPVAYPLGLIPHVEQMLEGIGQAIWRSRPS